MTEQSSEAAPPTACEVLCRALSHLTQRAPRLSANDAAVLQSHVHAAVDELKALGMPPERVIVIMKAAVGTAGTDHNIQRLIEQITEWAIVRYFRPPDPQLTP